MLSQDLLDLQSVVREFSQDVIRPQISEHYIREEFPLSIVNELGKLGVFGIPFPEEFGGAGGSYFAFCLVIEELARVDSSIAITVDAAVSLGAMPILRFGTEEQKRTWLPDLCSGDRLGAFGLTEPEGGSDAANTKTTAVREGQEWVISGEKSFITNAGTPISSLITVTAMTSQESTGTREISTFVIPTETKGLSVGAPYSKVGWCSSDTRPVYMDAVRISDENRLGPVGHGYSQFLQILDEGRVSIAALSAGLAQGCVDESVPYAQERDAFGGPIARFQAIGFKLADMEARAHSARLLWQDAARKMEAGQPFKREAAIAKLVASGNAVDNAREATQIFGGAGFVNETAVARMWRDSKILEIGEGTSEIQRLLIARELGINVTL